MTGRTHRTERGVAVAAFERIHCLEAAAGGEERGLPRRRRRARVDVQTSATLPAEALEAIEIIDGVHSFELFPSRPPGNEAAPGVARRAGIEPVEDGPHAIRPLRMAATGVVLLEAGVGRDQEHVARLTNGSAGRSGDIWLPPLRHPWLRCVRTVYMAPSAPPSLAPLRPHVRSRRYARRR
jgi:hypothetical protein